MCIGIINDSQSVVTNSLFDSLTILRVCPIVMLSEIPFAYAIIMLALGSQNNVSANCINLLTDFSYYLCLHNTAISVERQ